MRGRRRSSLARAAATLAMLVASGCHGHAVARTADGLPSAGTLSPPPTVFSVAGVDFISTTKLRLGPAPSTAWQDCLRASHALRFQLACPTALPAESRATVAPSEATCPDRALTFAAGCDGARRYMFASIELGAPHLVFVESPKPEKPEQIIYAPVAVPQPTRDRVIGHLHIRGSSVLVLEVQGAGISAFAGHTVLVWNHHDHTYAGGFHGHDKDAMALGLALVRTIRYVGHPRRLRGNALGQRDLRLQ